jgi:hypothetical protein
VAIGLTILVCGLVWLLLGIYGSNHMNLLTALTGAIFFAFISARMLARYWRNEVILAVRPTGLYDARIATDTIPWEEIKELVLKRREQEYQLAIILWPHKPGGKVRDHDIDLSALEGGSQSILEAISQYMPIRMEQ